MKDYPIIGITGNFDDHQLKLLPGYFRSIEQAGGVPFIIPPRKNFSPEDIDQVLRKVDALLLSGGADINPVLLGEDPVPALHGINDERDQWELELTRQAYDRQIPMLGICRGIQLLAAALGGTVLQDLPTALPNVNLLKHSQEAERNVATHFVRTEEGSLMRQLLGERLAVNSFHHQAVGETGQRFCVTARSADGVVEAIESTEGKDIVGVQWHPECFYDVPSPDMMPLFHWFVSKASEYGQAKALHQRILTLDSHCDTPMFFEEGVDLNRRDPKLLVDFRKMREGFLDTSIMVAYLPQGSWDDKAEHAITAHTIELLEEIKQRVAQNDNVALARTPQQLWQNKHEGKLSVMRGIENGYALGKDLSNVERFARMGVVYITLCHNGDNRICDSARKSEHTHGGLSEFGREVVKEMNRCGLMVDLSHAAESSFYDALELSATPIVCSHTASRALCNHPRNLTDEQLRALAEKGGVAQVTLYHGFLRSDEDEHGPATIDDAVDHLMHLIDVAGIDHVGIGTDFDGDGGVPGLACASEMLNFTRKLLARGLTPLDLEKVWGKNFLRVMQQCQDYASLAPNTQQ